MGERELLACQATPDIIDNQTDVSSVEPTSDVKSGLTVFVVREILGTGSRMLNGDVEGVG